MNKPAAKEPSMDEILSSIRQIIADDDAGPTPAPAPVEEVDPDSLGAGLPSFDAFLADEDLAPPPEPEPALEAMDLMAAAEEEVEALELSTAQIVEPEPEPEPEVHTPMQFPEVLLEPDDVSFDAAVDEEPAVEPLPDPTLSADLADHLLEPAAEQAATHAFARLGTIAIGDQAITLEAMIKEMLRPMLKQWLDENLPTVVEKLVEKEIDRVTRGGK